MSTGATTNIRSMGPYQVDADVWLTSVFPSDADHVFRVINLDSSIANGLYSSVVTFPFPQESAIAFTKGCVARRIKSGQETTWAIRRSVDGPLIGIFGTNLFDHGDDAALICDGVPVVAPTGSSQEERFCGDLGYWISPECAGQGIMSRVLTYGLQHLLRQEFGYNRVHGECWQENLASQRVMARAGMRPSPALPCFVAKFNTTKDVVGFVIDL
ncbi:hypothetical protein BGZ82_005637 [Podila clonocystis]|nr:hypothetical protein BGZ82_005637 [Podila clonocystis]